MKRDPSATEGTPDLGDQYKDEKTEKKIHEHLNNENDVITEQDIADAPVGPVHKDGATLPIDIPEETKDALQQTEEKKDTDKVKDNNDPGIDTSWNVLES